MIITGIRTGLAQQYYSFDLATGQGTLIQQSRRTFAANMKDLLRVGSLLVRISEFDTELCNTGSDPVTGLSSDVRIFTATGIGPQIGETCIDFGGEAAAAYNPLDGFIYSIASDDLLPGYRAAFEIVPHQSFNGFGNSDRNGNHSDGNQSSGRTRKSVYGRTGDFTERHGLRNGKSFRRDNRRTSAEVFIEFS